MKQRHLAKRISSLVLAAAMIAASLPAGSTQAQAAEVQAAEGTAELPGITEFATKEQLKGFDTDKTTEDKKSTPAAKVYFGKNGETAQGWWIAGCQDKNKDSVTLFAASPLATGQKFEPNYGSDKTYNTAWGCTYQSAPTDVFPNHYGASPLRGILRALEGTTSKEGISSCFTDAELSLMNDTTIYTNDTKNSSVYSTTEKLYLAYGDDSGQYITVGTNTSSQLNGGLHIDKEYWGNSNFWQRAPYMHYSSRVLAARPGPSVDYFDVDDAYALVPAFELNLSSVIFASAAQAASSDGKLTVGDAFTLRYNAEPQKIGKAAISNSGQSISVTGIANESTYLVAQNNAGAWAKKVTGGDIVFASEMGEGLTSFENCRVWLETTDTDKRMTYAVMADKSSSSTGKNVKVKAGEGMTVSEKAIQSGVATAMETITVTANAGYYFPTDYSVTAQNGISVTRNSYSQLTISGTPTADVMLTLTDATEKGEQQAPVVTGGIGLIGGTTTAMEYAMSAGSASWTDCTNNSTAVDAGTYSVRYKETDTKKVGLAKEVTVTAPTYTVSASPGKLDFGTKNEGYATDGLSKTVTITNTGNSKVTLQTPPASNYTCSLSGTEIAAGGSVTLTVTPKAGLTNGTYNETITASTTENKTVAVDVSFQVNGALTVSLSTSLESIIEGQSATLTAEASGGSGNYSYTWYENDVKKDSLTGKEVTVSPTQTTTYKVEVSDTIENKSAAATITVIPKRYDLGVPADCAFEEQQEGYADVPAKGLTIQNTGNADITKIGASLTGTNADAFTLDISGMQRVLAPSEETTVSIKPKTGLSAGTYQAELEITGDHGVQKSVTVTFTVKKLPPSHTHNYGTEWKSDSKSHWHECICGEKSGTAAHTEDSGSVTKQPTESETGIRTYKCSVCGYVMRTEEIGKLTPAPTEKPTNPPAEKPQETVTPAEIKENSEKLDSGISTDFDGNKFNLSWEEVDGAEGYDIFAAPCGKTKLDAKSRIKTVKGKKTSASLAKIAGRKISGKSVYKVKIKAWRYVDGKKVYIGSSRAYHVAGKANKKYTNAKKLKPWKKKYALKKGKSTRIKVTIVKQSKRKKLLPKSHGPALRYESGNKKIATVTQEGRVKAKKKGVCYITVTALNGVRTRIKITVK